MTSTGGVLITQASIVANLTTEVNKKETSAQKAHWSSNFLTSPHLHHKRLQQSMVALQLEPTTTHLKTTDYRLSLDFASSQKIMGAIPEVYLQDNNILCHGHQQIQLPVAFRFVNSNTVPVL